MEFVDHRAATAAEHLLVGIDGFFFTKAWEVSFGHSQTKIPSKIGDFLLETLLLGRNFDFRDN